MNIVDLINRISGMAVKRVVAGGNNVFKIILRLGDDEFSIRIPRVWRLEHRGRVIAGGNDSKQADQQAWAYL